MRLRLSVGLLLVCASSIPPSARAETVTFLVTGTVYSVFSPTALATDGIAAQVGDPYTLALTFDSNAPGQTSGGTIPEARFGAYVGAITAMNWTINGSTFSQQLPALADYTNNFITISDNAPRMNSAFQDEYVAALTDDITTSYLNVGSAWYLFGGPTPTLITSVALSSVPPNTSNSSFSPYYSFVDLSSGNGGAVLGSVESIANPSEVVPIPASGWLMLGAVAGMSAFIRRKSALPAFSA